MTHQELQVCFIIAYITNMRSRHSFEQEFWVVLEKSVGEQREIDYDDFLRICKLLQNEKAQ